MSKRWINTKVEFEWDGTQYVETSADGYWYEGDMGFCTGPQTDTNFGGAGGLATWTTPTPGGGGENIQQTFSC